MKLSELIPYTEEEKKKFFYQSECKPYVRGKNDY